MEAEGAELSLSGGPFPPGALDHLRSLLTALYEKAGALLGIENRQELDRIPDAVLRSTLEMCDQDMAEAEASFELEELAVQTAGGVIVDQSRKVAEALADLRGAVQDAQRDGIRFVLERDETK